MSARPLPIHSVRAQFDAALAAGPVVVSSPTGSGKSTELPRWASAARGRVLVVEPRRVACRALAARVAELEGVRLGTAVGYAVRDESLYSDDTRILFVTPGVVLHAQSMAARFDVLLLDEFHERSLELDLLLALFARGPGPRLVVTSATIDGERVAAHLGAVHIAAQGSVFPVEIHYLDTGPTLPHAAELAGRVARALEGAAKDPGDVLVFLPGKGEIDACLRTLRAPQYELIPLHGGLTLEQQRRAFEPSGRRKVLLATNVAETSLTVPGIGVVLDSGLVRRTRYHAGRGFLTLGAIALDSAAQRTGRAGRTAPGVCYRLWGRGAGLEGRTPPELHRESLVPLVLGAAAWGRRVSELALFDPPREPALTAARDELARLGALDEREALTARGRALYALPIDIPLANLLLEARETGCLDDAVDLVSALAVGRPLFLPGEADDELRRGDCDATALVRAVREGREHGASLSHGALDEALRTRARLRRALGLAQTGPSQEPFDREALVRTALRADPRAAYVARLRGRSLTFSNGGTELELARESAVQRARDVEAVVLFESRALGAGREARVLMTCASPVTGAELARAGLGEERLAHVALERSKVLARVERVYAKRVLSVRDEVPEGALAREALAVLFVRGSLFKDALPVTRARLERSALAVKLGHAAQLDPSVRAGPTLDEWVRARLGALGVQSADELAMLSSEDLLAPSLPDELAAELEREFPHTVSVGDAAYEAHYDLGARRVTLELVRGQRREPPPLAYLPRFAGLGIVVIGPRGTTVLR